MAASVNDKIERFFRDNNGKTFAVSIKAVRIEPSPAVQPSKNHDFSTYGSFSLLSPLQRRADEDR